MDLTCKKCGSTFRAAITLPLTTPVRVACPRCEYQMVLKPRTVRRACIPILPTPSRRRAPTRIPRRRIAAIADEPRPFRDFLGEQLRRLGFDVAYFETGDPTLDFVRRTRADLVIVNVYLKGKLGVEVTEEIKADPALEHTRVILIGALFRANRFRANPTNLYGADEYIEEQIPEKEFRQIIRKLFPEVGDDRRGPARAARIRRSPPPGAPHPLRHHHLPRRQGGAGHPRRQLLRDPPRGDRRRPPVLRLARARCRVRRDTEIYTETLQQFVQMKREELELKTGTERARAIADRAPHANANCTV